MSNDKTAAETTGTPPLAPAVVAPVDRGVGRLEPERAEARAPMWCSHCDKTTHNDRECWSTRGMNQPDPWWFLYDADRCDGDDPRADAYEAAWGRAQDAFDSIRLRGASEWQDKVRLAVRVLAAAAPEVFAAEIAALARLKTPNDELTGRPLGGCN